MYQAHIKQKLGLRSAAELSEKSYALGTAIDAAKPAIKETAENCRLIFTRMLKYFRPDRRSSRCP
jgi:hypothetical protein